MNDTLAEKYNEEERRAREWIKGNPHLALKFAVQAHRSWHGCDCELHALLNNMGFCERYQITPENEEREGDMNIGQFSTERQKQLRDALAEIAKTQTAFWNALATFEQLSGMSIDDTADLTDYEQPTDADIQAVIDNHSEDR